MAGVEVGQQTGDVDVVCRHRADGDGTGDQRRDLVDRAPHVGDGGQRRPSVGQHRRTRRCHTNRPRRPVQKGLAQFAFEFLDLRADGRLSDVHAVGGSGEVRLVGDGQEVFELAQFHKRSR